MKAGYPTTPVVRGERALDPFPRRLRGFGFLSPVEYYGGPLMVVGLGPACLRVLVARLFVAAKTAH